MIFNNIKIYKTALVFKHFDCGEENLNKYIRTYAYMNDENNLSKTFICEDDGNIVGFVTLCNAHIEFDEMPVSYKRLMTKYPVPSVKIARLAVDKKYQGMGYGKSILLYAFKKIIQVSVSTGVKVISVDVKESSKGFYEKFGFVDLGSGTYILRIETLIDALI